MFKGKMYKVISPIEGKDGNTKFWMRCGSGFTNKDDSINLYLDALPLGQKEVKLQLRELTEDELRERADKRASYSASRPGSSGPGAIAAPVQDSIPF